MPKGFEIKSGFRLSACISANTVWPSRPEVGVSVRCAHNCMPWRGSIFSEIFKSPSRSSSRLRTLRVCSHAHRTSVGIGN